MRMLLHAKLPHREFNAVVRDGSIGKKISRILDETKPESVYLTRIQRPAGGGIMIADVGDSSKVPAHAELCSFL